MSWSHSALISEKKSFNFGEASEVFASKAKINVFTFLDSCSNVMERPQTGQESEKEISTIVDFMFGAFG